MVYIYIYIFKVITMNGIYLFIYIFEVMEKKIQVRFSQELFLALLASHIGYFNGIKIASEMPVPHSLGK